MKQYFINCRIPYKLGHIITRWNWETVWECAPPFFQGLQPGKTGPLSQPGARRPSRCGWRFISFTAHIILITSLIQVILHPWKSHRCHQVILAHLTLHRSFELNITVEPTLAAAAMHMSASDELFKMNRKLVTFSLVGLSATLEIYDTNITRIWGVLKYRC